MKPLTYWYQFFTAREELVQILHGVKFTKCEIYGSTELYQSMLLYNARNTGCAFDACLINQLANLHSVTLRYLVLMLNCAVDIRMIGCFYY